MVVPTLRDVYDWLDLRRETTPELSKYQSELCEKLEKYMNNDKTADDISLTASMLASESQYLGFVQGLRLAIAIFCEN